MTASELRELVGWTVEDTPPEDAPPDDAPLEDVPRVDGDGSRCPLRTSADYCAQVPALPAAPVIDGELECGLVLRNFQDIKIGDVVEAFEMREIPRS